MGNSEDLRKEMIKQLCRMIGIQYTDSEASMKASCLKLLSEMSRPGPSGKMTRDQKRAEKLLWQFADSTKVDRTNVQ